MIEEITDGSFAEFVQSNEVSIVDFYASWCPPCKLIAPFMESLSENYNVAKIDVESNRQSMVEYGVQSVPQVIFFKNNKEVKRLVGAHSLNDYLNEVSEMEHT